jgi:hypothetical protein
MGARNRLGEAFIADLEMAWKEHRISTISRVIEDRPQDFLKIVVGLLPKNVDLNVDPYSDLTDK